MQALTENYISKEAKKEETARKGGRGGVQRRQKEHNTLHLFLTIGTTELHL